MNAILINIEVNLQKLANMRENRQQLGKFYGNTLDSRKNITKSFFGGKCR